MANVRVAIHYEDAMNRTCLNLKRFTSLRPSLQDFAFFHNMMLYINRKTMPMLWGVHPICFLI
jgi:hypothetical protein